LATEKTNSALHSDAVSPLPPPLNNSDIDNGLDSDGTTNNAAADILGEFYKFCSVIIKVLYLDKANIEEEEIDDQSIWFQIFKPAIYNNMFQSPKTKVQVREKANEKLSICLLKYPIVLLDHNSASHKIFLRLK
jgi:hypothetical protein